MLTASAAALALTSLLTPHVAAPSPLECAVIDGAGQCLVEAADPGRAGGPRERGRNGGRDQETRAPSRREADPPASDQGPAEPTAQPEPPLFGGVPLISGGRTGSGVGAFEQIPLPPEPEESAGVAPAVLAQRAVESLDLQPSELRMSVSGLAFVGVPVWLWVEPGLQGSGPVSATASAGAAAVTATARLAAVEWTLGPPGEQTRCPGPGTPWSGQPASSPDCGYTYTLRSLPERTGGRDSWPVSATVIWQIEWAGVSGGSPVSGTQTLRLTSETSLAVGEVQVLVDGGGG